MQLINDHILTYAPFLWYTQMTICWLYKWQYSIYGVFI